MNAVSVKNCTWSIELVRRPFLSIKVYVTPLGGFLLLLFFATFLMFFRSKILFTSAPTRAQHLRNWPEKKCDVTHGQTSNVTHYTSLTPRPSFEPDLLYGRPLRVMSRVHGMHKTGLFQNPCVLRAVKITTAI